MESFDSHDVEAHYELLEPVGKGGMGTVYKARHKESQELFAIKVLSKELSRTRVQRERFFREAKTAQSLSHQNIVSVIEVAYLKGLPCIVMEFLEGETLYEQFKRGLSLAVGISRLLQVVDALLYAHEKGITHRDLKPANIMVSADGVVKVADWGLAKTTTDETGLTKTGLLVGTPTYMAPEQVVGEPTEARTDLYALGVMLYELCAKTTPFTGTLAQILTAKLQERAPSLLSVNRALPNGLPELVNDLLRRDPKTRPTTSEVNRRLTVILDRLTSRKAREVKETLPSKAPPDTRPSIAPNAVQLPKNTPSPYLFLLIALIALSLGYFAGNSGIKGKPVSKRKLILPLVSSVRLVDLNEIRLNLSRQAMPGYIDYEIETLDGDGSNYPNGRFELQGKSLQEKLLSIKVPSCVFETINIKLDVKEKSEGGTLKYEQVFAISPRALLDKLFEPIDRLKNETLNRLVKDTQTLATENMVLREDGVPEKIRMPKITQRLAQRVDQEGLSLSHCERLAHFLPKLIKREPWLGEALALRLLPLRHVERSAMDYVCPTPPWKFCINNAFGFQYGRNSLPKSRQGWQTMAYHSLLTKESNGEHVWLWMANWTMVGQFQSSKALSEIVWHPVNEVITTMNFMASDERRPVTADLVATKTIKLVTKLRGNFHWPPKKAQIAFTTRLFGPETVISLRVNNSPLINIINTASFSLTYEQSFSTTQMSWTAVPLNPKWLRKDINTVFIQPQKVPGPQPPTPICFKDVALYVCY